MKQILKSMKYIDLFTFLLTTMMLVSFQETQNSSIILQTFIFGIAVSAYFQLATQNGVVLGFSVFQIFLYDKMNVWNSENKNLMFLMQSIFLFAFFISGISNLIYKFISFQTLLIFKILGASFFMSIFVLKTGISQSEVFIFALFLIFLTTFLWFKTKYLNFKFVPMFLLLILILTIKIFSGNHSQIYPQNLNEGVNWISFWIWEKFEFKIEAKTTVSAFILAFGLLIESLMTIKSLSLKNEFVDYSNLMPRLLVANFLSCIFGFLPISFPLILNTVGNKSIVKKKLVFYFLLMAGLFLILKYCGYFLFLKESLTLALAIQIILTCQLIKFKELKFVFRTSKARFSVLLLCFVVSLILNNRIIAFALNFFLEVFIYSFEVSSVFGFEKAMLEEMPAEVQNKHLEMGKEAIVYSLENGFNFLYIDRHLANIGKIGISEIVVDFSKLIKNYDAFYSENYKEMVKKLKEFENIGLHCHGLNESWNQSREKEKQHFQLKHLAK